MFYVCVGRGVGSAVQLLVRNWVFDIGANAEKPLYSHLKPKIIILYPKLCQMSVLNENYDKSHSRLDGSIQICFFKRICF